MDKKNFTCFLSYAHEDINIARKIFNELKRAGASVWFDEESIQPGEKWIPALRKGIRNSRYFIALLSSKSVSKKGYVQHEIREALNILDEYPDDKIYLIPIRLDDCTPSHEKLRELNWINFFPDIEHGVSTLLRFFGLTQPESSLNVKESIGESDNLATFTILRFNGLYQSKDHKGYWSYLRFFNDGIILSVSSTGTPKDVIKWLKKENQTKYSVGKYLITGRDIKFSSTSKRGTVDYEGRIEGNKLILKFHSQINGNRGVKEFNFFKI